MADLDQLERLARLHASGALTDAEYAEHKRRLFNCEGSHAPPGADPIGSKGRVAKFRRPLCAAALVGVGALAWHYSTRLGLLHDIAADETLQPASVDWKLTLPSDTKDPDYDNQLSAERTFASERFKVDVSISCRPSSGNVFYSLQLMTADGKPAPARAFIEGNTSGYQLIIRREGAAEERRSATTGSPDWLEIMENRENFEAGTRYGQTLGYLPDAKQLQVKVPLVTGTPSFVIDQTDARVARVLAACDDQAAARTASEPASLGSMSQPAARVPSAPSRDAPSGGPVTALFEITDQTLKGTRSSHPQPGGSYEACVGDTILVRNNSSQRITLVGSEIEGSDAIDVDVIEAGSELSYEIQLEGPWFLTVRNHPSAHYNYEAIECH